MSAVYAWPYLKQPTSSQSLSVAIGSKVSLHCAKVCTKSMVKVLLIQDDGVD